jgi:hypothetical protein
LYPTDSRILSRPEIYSVIHLSRISRVVVQLKSQLLKALLVYGQISTCPFSMLWREICSAMQWPTLANQKSWQLPCQLRRINK